jgi:hypothetical protein
MPSRSLPTALQFGPKPFSLLLALAVTMALQPRAAAVPAPINLGTAGDFAVLAGSGITITGPTTITGDIGTFPTPAITGLANLTLTGANHADDAVSQLAKDDLVTAYNVAAGLSYDLTYGGGFDLVGLTLPSGIYNGSSSLFLSGTLTLDAQGNPDAVWIFQTGSTLITASASVISLIGGAQACHVFWQVGSSATLGTDSSFIGNIMALTSITLTTGATVEGSLLARNGAVTLDNNTITEAICLTTGTDPAAVPEAADTLAVLAAGAGFLIVNGLRRRGVATA